MKNISSVLAIIIITNSIVMADAPSTQRLAVLSSEQVQQSGLSELVMIHLQKLEDIELVERDRLGAVFNEIAFSAMLGAENPENRQKNRTNSKC